jgi:hypothetical protein
MLSRSHCPVLGELCPKSEGRCLESGELCLAFSMAELPPTRQEVSL